MSRATATIRARPARGRAADVRRVTAAEDVAPFLEDAAHYPGGHAPAVVLPESEAEVAAALRAARHVLAVGAQSSLTGGATPFGEVVLSTARLADVGAWRAESVVVGPGVVLAALAPELAARDLYYPPVPTYDGATVGGTVATNAAGAATFKYGTTREWIAALTVVLANGDVLDLRRGEVRAGDDGCFEVVGTDGARARVPVPRYRMPDVPKISSGYYAAPGMDLIDLFVGSEGTLGVVTAVELKLLAHRPAWLVGLVPVADDDAALRLVAELRDASRHTWESGDPRGIDVAAIEYMDRRSLALLRADGADTRVGVALPEAAGAAILFQVELDPAVTRETAAAELGRVDDPTCDTRLARLCRLLQRHDVLEATLPALPGEDGRRAALFALREAVPQAVNRRIGEAQRTIDPAISKSGGDVIVPFARLAEALRGYRRILEERDLDHAVWGHVSDGNLHPNVLPRSAAEAERARAAQLAIGELAIALGGAPMSEHGTGRNAVKQELLRRLYGDDGIADMRRVKAALDPTGRLAPGVLFPRAATPVEA